MTVLGVGLEANLGAVDLRVDFGVGLGVDFGVGLGVDPTGLALVGLAKGSEFALLCR